MIAIKTSIVFLLLFVGFTKFQAIYELRKICDLIKQPLNLVKSSINHDQLIGNWNYNSEKILYITVKNTHFIFANNKKSLHINEEYH